MSICATCSIEEWVLVRSNLQSIYKAIIVIIVSSSPGKLACGNVDSRPNIRGGGVR